MKTSSSATTAAICLITFFFGMSGCLLADQSQEMAELKAAVAAMQKTIVQLQGEVATLKQQQAQPAARQTATSPLAALKEAVLPANAAAPASGEALKPAPLFTQAPTTPQRPMVYDDIQASPLALNSAYGPRFAGFHELGDSGWWIHVGGLLKTDLWFGQNNNTDTVTNGLGLYQSRIHVDLRSDSDLGPVRLYYESNFTWDLRHLYAQIGGLTFGQTWSAFYDPSAAPDLLNNFTALGYRLSPQIRYTFPSQNEHFRLTMAVESNPSEYLYGTLWNTQGTLSSRLPDFLLQARWEAEKGHLQLAGVLRDLHYASRFGDNEQDTLGYGLSLSGALHLTQRDHLMAGLMAGNGINRYFSGISSDSASLNNDDTIDMQQAWSAFIGYQHLWNDKLRSQITWRHDSSEENLDRWNSRNTADADILQANLIWNINAQLHAGFEYQYRLLNEKADTHDQESHSLMFSLMYRFF